MPIGVGTPRRLTAKTEFRGLLDSLRSEIIHDKLDVQLTMVVCLRSICRSSSSQRCLRCAIFFADLTESRSISTMRRFY